MYAFNRFAYAARSCAHALHPARSVLLIVLTGALLGCGSGVHGLSGLTISGSVRVSGQSATWAAIDLLALSATSGRQTQHLLQKAVHVGSDGTFQIESGYLCEEGSKLLLVAQGNGNQTGEIPGAVQPSLAALIGECGDSETSKQIVVDELSTITAAYALAPVTTSNLTTLIESPSPDQLDNAVRLAVSTTALLRSAEQDPDSPASQIDPVRKIMTLGNIASSCVGSAGTRGNSGVCRQFVAAAQTDKSTPTDLASAMLAVAQHPTNNVLPIYSLGTVSAAVFQPALTQSPQDWSLSFDTPPTPSLYPSPGTYAPGQVIEITGSSSNTLLYYDVGAGWQRYTKPLALNTNTTVRAVAVANGLSAATTAQYTVASGGLTLLAPSVVPVGQAATAVLTLTNPAPSGGYNVQLSSSDATIAAPSNARVIIPAGQTATSISISGKGPGTVILTASAQGLNSATANVQVAASISATLSPTAAYLIPGQTQQFMATVTGSSNSAVRWSLSPAIGTISMTGLYTAPSMATQTQTILLTATSTADPARSATALIQLAPIVTVGTLPAGASLTAGHSQQFTAFVTGAANTGVHWTMSPNVGSVTVSGLYTAPASIVSPLTVVVTATSNADPSKSASSTVQINPAVTIVASPTSTSLTAGQSQQFSALITGSSNTGVRWTTSPSVGSVSATGFYIAPVSVASAQTVVLTATSSADPTKAANAVVEIKPAVAISASPASASLIAGQSQQFTAQVTGSTNTGVRWTMNPSVGSLSSTGLYAAPSSVVAAQLLTITATSSADATKVASVTIRLTPKVNISLTPSVMNLSQGQSQQLSASITGSTNTVVHWTLSPAVGSLSATGLYTAPPVITAPQVLSITASSDADPSQTAIASLHLVPIVGISAAPAAVQLVSGQSQQFSALVTGATNSGVVWSLSPAIGTLTSAGLYTSPAAVTPSQLVTITATSLADPGKRASAMVLITPVPAITLVLSDTTVPISGNVPGTVRLSYPLPSDTVVQLAAQQAGMITLPASVTILAGQTQASFSIQGTAMGATTLVATATGLASQSATITTVPAPITGKFFGMSVNNFTNISAPMAYGTARSWDAFPTIAWSDINTARGVFNFTSLDTFLQANRSRDVIYTFGRTPLWASSKPTQPGTYGVGQCAPPSDLAVWDEYVRAIVTHAAGRIKYWELWNEPSGPGFYCGDMSTLVQMAAHAYSIIKGIDPTAVVLSPPMTDALGPSWAGYFFFLGGSRYVDVVAFHGYSSFRAEDIAGVVASYRAVMVANGIGDKPLWDTESSWAGNGNLGTPTMAQQTAYLAKSYILHASSGVDRFVWYAYDGGQTWGGLQNSAGQPSGAAAAYIQTEAWLLGASLTSCSTGSDGTWSCALTRSGGYSARILWNDALTPTVTVPASLTQYRDLSGVTHAVVNHTVTLGAQPILVESSTPVS